tara:strand:- start:318 stop:722 length:405 start_codon:yes stop_codon:yes gene_type:complete
MDIESKSWICNYLKKKYIIDNSEFLILSRFGAWTMENHPDVIKAYWSYLDKLMKKFDKVETVENAKKIFRPWVDETLGFIKSSQLKRAYISFCKMVILLTEKYNSDNSLFSNQELITYLKIKKSLSQAYENVYL